MGPPGRLYLIFAEQQVNRLAFWFGLGAADVRAAPDLRRQLVRLSAPRGAPCRR